MRKAFQNRTSALIAGLFLLGLGLRLFRLASVPLGGHGDVAWNGIEALDWLHGYTWPFYVYHIYAPEPLIIYLTGLSILIFGPTFFAARFVTSLASALVIPVGFAAVRHLREGRDDLTTQRTAWIFALAYAVSFYPIILSKTGQRAQVFPLFVVALMALFAYAWRSGKWRAWIGTAVVLALANYLYIPARIMPVMLVLWVGYEWLRARGTPRNKFPGYGFAGSPSGTRLLQFAAMLAIAALLISPQIAMYVRTPEAFTARADQSAGQLIFRTLDGSELWLTLGRKILGEFAIFLLPWRGAYAEMAHPLLELPLALGAIIGAVWALRRFHDRVLWWSLLGIPVMFATDVVSGTQLEPHGLRMIGVMPLAFILASRGCALTWEWLEARTQPRAWFRPALAALIIVPGLIGLWRYHFEHIPALKADPATTNRLEAADVFLAELILEHADDGMPILISMDDFTRPNVTYLLSQKYPVRRSGIRANRSPEMLNLHSGLLVAMPAEPFRPRHDGIIPEHDGRAWVMLYDGEMHLLLTMSEGLNDKLSDAPVVDTVFDWSGRPVASLHKTLSMGSLALPALIESNFNGQVALAAYDWAIDDQEIDLYDRTLQPGRDLWITLYWQALTSIPEDYEVFVQVLDQSGQAVAQAHRWTLDGEYRTRMWRTDELVPTRFRLDIPSDLPPGLYTIIAGLYRVLENEPIPLVSADNLSYSPHATLPTAFRVALPSAVEVVPQSTKAVFRDSSGVEVLWLVGYTSELLTFNLTLKFDWQSAGPSQSYIAFIHVVNEAGDIVAQADTQPRGGSYPTNIWDAGEIIPDEITIPLPADLPAGEYAVYIGWYIPPSGPRLYAYLDDERVPDDRVKIFEFSLP